jgi:hypothetical protein
VLSRIKLATDPEWCLKLKDPQATDGTGGLELARCGTGAEFLFSIGGQLTGTSKSGFFAVLGPNRLVCVGSAAGEPIVPANIVGAIQITTMNCGNEDPFWTLVNPFSETGGKIRKMNRFPNPKGAPEETDLCLVLNPHTNAVELDSCFHDPVAFRMMWRAERP